MDPAQKEEIDRKINEMERKVESFLHLLLPLLAKYGESSSWKNAENSINIKANKENGREWHGMPKSRLYNGLTFPQKSESGKIKCLEFGCVCVCPHCRSFQTLRFS